MADKLRTQQQLEQLQARYVGTGHADTSPFEFKTNYMRDYRASMIGHPELLQHTAVGMGVSRERIRLAQIDAMIVAAGHPPQIPSDLYERAQAQQHAAEQAEKREKREQRKRQLRNLREVKFPPSEILREVFEEVDQAMFLGGAKAKAPKMKFSTDINFPNAEAADPEPSKKDVPMKESTEVASEKKAGYMKVSIEVASDNEDVRTTDSKEAPKAEGQDVKASE